MFLEILKFIGGVLWMFLRIILILALSAGGLYCLGSALFFRFLWEGLIRLAIGLVCGAAVFLIIRLSREKDDGPAPGEERF